MERSSLKRPTSRKGIVGWRAVVWRITSTMVSRTRLLTCRQSLRLHHISSEPFTDSDALEFYIVSLDNKQWHFEAANSEERDDWVAVIEKEIFKSLQGNESSKTKPQSSSELASLQSIRSRIPGNGFCVDCDAPGTVDFSVCSSIWLRHFNSF